MTDDSAADSTTDRPTQAFKPPKPIRSKAPPRPHENQPSSRVMLSDFDYLSVAQDIIARADAWELDLLYAAIRDRQEELGLEGPTTRDHGQGGDPDEEPVSGVVERRSHDNGELVLARRSFTRKDGGKVWRGPYWYFYFREGGKQETIYLGKTDDPEGALAKKRSEP